MSALWNNKDEGCFMEMSRFVAATALASLVVSPLSAKNLHNGPEYLSATRVSYFLPKTRVTLTLSLVLRNCGQMYDPTGKKIAKLNSSDLDSPQVAASLTVAASGVADRSARYDFSASNLQSWRVKRNLDLTLNDNGTLAGLNSTSTDQTASIFGSVLKFVASIVVPLAAEGAVSPYQCNKDSAAADLEARTLEARIAALRDKMLTTDKADSTKWKDDLGLIDTLATRVGTLRTGQLLVTVTKDLKLGEATTASPLLFESPDLDKWFDPPTAARLKVINAGRAPAEQVDASKAADLYPDWFHFSYMLKRKRPVTFAAGVTDPAAGDKGWTNSLTTLPENDGASAGTGCPDDDRCERTLVFRRPVDATLAIYGEGFVQQDKTVPMIVLDVPVGQWGTLSYLSLDAKLLSNRTVNLTMDAFGRVKTMTWQTEAKGQTLAGALGGAADSMGNVRKAIAGKTDVQREADQVTELDTQRKLNALLACREVLNAGGFTCPGT